MNNVNLIGYVVKDLELKEYEQGEFVQFNVAINDYNYKTKEKYTSFIEVVAFGAKAKVFAEHLKKGSKIAVQGKLNQSSYINSEGKKIYKVKVIAERIEFLESTIVVNNA